MLPRHAMTDDEYARVEGLLPTRGPAADDRRFLDAVLYVARTGIPWRDLPERFGNWNSAWRRFDRWARAGRWAPILVALRGPDLDLLILASTAARAHPCAAGAKKSGTAAAARPSRPSAAAAAGSARRSTGRSTGSATPS